MGFLQDAQRCVCVRAAGSAVLLQDAGVSVPSMTHEPSSHHACVKLQTPPASTHTHRQSLRLLFPCATTHTHTHPHTHTSIHIHIHIQSYTYTYSHTRAFICTPRRDQTSTACVYCGLHRSDPVRAPTAIHNLQHSPALTPLSRIILSAFTGIIPSVQVCVRRPRRVSV